MTRRSEPGPDRSVLLLLLAAMVTIAVVGLVLTVGVHRPPALATLGDQPEVTLPAPVAFSRDRGRGTCLVVVDTRGEESAVMCREDRISVDGWTDDGHIQISLHARNTKGSGGTPHEVDFATGQIRIVRETRPPVRYDSPYQLRGGREDGRFVLRLFNGEVDPDGRIIWSADAPERYADARDVIWGPGGDIALVRDSADRLLLVDVADGTEPRVVAVDARRPAWGPATG